MLTLLVSKKCEILIIDTRMGIIKMTILDQHWLSLMARFHTPHCLVLSLVAAVNSLNVYGAPSNILQIPLCHLLGWYLYFTWKCFYWMVLQVQIGYSS
jgi:hypothetical protein